MLIGQALASVGIWTGKEVKDEYWQIMQEELDKL
jgi:shikimate 5-dehydrogenase